MRWLSGHRRDGIITCGPPLNAKLATPRALSCRILSSVTLSSLAELRNAISHPILATVGPTPSSRPTRPERWRLLFLYPRRKSSIKPLLYSPLAGPHMLMCSRTIACAVALQYATPSEGISRTARVGRAAFKRNQESTRHLSKDERSSSHQMSTLW